jgi:hypothetical protein
MNPQTQTLKFLVAAVVSVLLAWGTWYGTRPTPVEGFGKVGEQFFADLKVNKATALRVVVFDDEQADMDDFIVQKVNGVWELPGYNHYPADGEDRLGKTAASLVGIERGALASRQATDHARLGVVDPEEKSQELTGRGQKITIFKGEAGDLSEKIKMAELIVGNEVPDQTGSYYVRIPDEKETYIASLEIDLSTKFRDWVEDDLLKLDRDKIARLESRTTKVDGQDIVESVESLLTRESSSDDWELDGLNEETEEVNKDDVREMVSTLDNLKLAGVRVRPMLEGKQILGGDLTVILPEGAPPQYMNQIMRMFQRDLQPKGFFLYGNVEKPSLYTSSGELVAGTKDGIRYHMSFGDEFQGTDKEIEVGGTSTAKAEATEGEDAPVDATEEEDKPAGPEEAGDAEPDDESDDDADSGLKKSRYLFVRATFDETLLGPELVEPVKPAVPEGVEVDEDGNVIEPEEPDEPETPTTPETPKPPALPANPTEENKPTEPEKEDTAPSDADSDEAADGDVEAAETETPKAADTQETTDQADKPEAADTPKPVDAPEAADTPKPADATEPADTPKPADATEPADKPKPADATEPADKPKPADATEPADKPKPADATEPADKPKPADATEPADKPKPADATEPADKPKPADATEPADKPKPADATEPADKPKPADATEPADKPETDASETTPEIFKPDPVEDYKKALTKYRADKSEFERETKDRETKSEEGLETVEELNERFGNWYYVISADDFNKLRLTRDQVVTAKEKPEPEPGDDPPEDTPEKPAETTPEKPAAPPEPTDLDPAAKPADAPAPAKPAAKPGEAATPDKPAEAKPAPADGAAAKKPAEPATPAKPTPDKPAAAAATKPPATDSPAKPAGGTE